MLLTEIFHQVDSNPYQAPIRSGDVLRVFHGFSEMDEALKVARIGLTGRTKAARRFSYENDNNPYGLFVTVSLKIAKDFTAGHQDGVLIEFNAAERDLEAPVWPGGSYTVQGGLSQYFGHGREGRIARRQVAKAAEQNASERARFEPGMAHVAGSDRKCLADLLTTTREQQALFIGDLNPQDIVAFWVKPEGSPWDAEWIRLSRDAFLERYQERPAEKSAKIFGPADAFDGERFRRGIEEAYRTFKMPVDRIFQNAWKAISGAERPSEAFVNRFGRFLWPRQYTACVQWLRKTYRQVQETNIMRENIKITENGEENPSVETLVALTREMIDGIPEVIIRHVEKSVMSSSTYFSISRADGKPWHLTKSQSRRYFTEFPKANGITAFGNFEIRISDHRAVSCRSAPNASVRSIADIAVVARQIKFFLSFP